MTGIDYRDAYAINTAAIDGVETNTCRTQLLGRCALTTNTGASFQFYLGKECIGEATYQADIAQVPTSEVLIVFARERYKLMKRFADDADTVIQITEPAHPVTTFAGFQVVWTKHELLLPERELEPLTGVKHVIEAAQAGRPILCRTVIVAADHTALIEYPGVYINWHPSGRDMQVDIGPVLVPDGPVSDDVDQVLASVQLAYVLYQGFTDGELVFRRPTPLGDRRTLHYSEVKKIQARHELFALR